MKKYLILIVLVLAPTLSANGQKFAVKNNILGDAMLTPNLAVEFRLGKKWTLDTYASYNPFLKSDRGIKTEWTPEDAESGKMLKHWMIQPELRYWTCEAFNGLFIGLHAMGGEHNIAGIEWPPVVIGDKDGDSTLQKNLRYQGYFLGGGLSIGHQWILAKRWNLEASLGAGYVMMKHDEIDPADPCNIINKDTTFNMIWVTKATVSIVFLIK